MQSQFAHPGQGTQNKHKSLVPGGLVSHSLHLPPLFGCVWRRRKIRYASASLLSNNKSWENIGIFSNMFLIEEEMKNNV